MWEVSEFEVLDSVVEPISVDVMNELSPCQRPSQVFGHARSMLGDVPVAAAHRCGNVALIVKADMSVALPEPRPTFPLRVAAATEPAMAGTESNGIRGT